MENQGSVLIFIKNQLDDDYSLLFDVKDASITTFVISMDEIEQTIDQINKDIKKEHFLMVIKKEFFDSNVLNKVIQVFSEKLSFFSPYFLYLFENDISKTEEDIILKGENYLYRLPPKDVIDRPPIIYNFNMFVKFIFQKLISKERLTSYIVDSFQTIIDSELIQIQKREIEKLNEEVTQKNKEIIELSKVDFLTNLLNRRAFFEALDAEKKRTIRDHWRIATSENIDRIANEDKLFDKNPDGKFLEHFGRFACLLFDIDHFKNINDTYGHITGDQVLRKIGEVLKEKNIFRENDIFGRFGGEEFIIILPETSSFHARIPAERLREKIKEIDFYDDKKNVFHISISIGIAEFSINDTSNEDLIHRADQALYYAKEQGRDKVVIFEEVF
ncbi:MAG: hypothetical protein A2086_09455 [Spirochaetes bacterium GWD1_27_9]|nr:MAG: hypothetical protein A2Z98_06015 [Spirochaetes bacterium GWB1_27_13]OHD25027.1 MAG: hypothetical protein A2Y34_03105 [Spirochaetes bacterium GWC1_27_15]OHD29721.1 MAG: hypothetical protein A2086_09455 [Spirochaetes bacterium GWD1_27_9]